MAPAPGRRELGADEQALQALGRLTFGPRPGELARVRATGVDRWIDQQLHPESIPDGDVETILARFPALSGTAQSLAQANPPRNAVLAAMKREQAMTDSVTYIPSRADTAYLRTLDLHAAQLVNEIAASRVIRAERSERQLQEVMVDFWENHFSVYQAKLPSRFEMLEYDRDVIRAHALGKFRDLLGAVAHSPAMLYYLDNWQSQADSLHLNLAEWSPLWTAERRPPNKRRTGLNENYGRELLELHTLGVDGGYTQQDVINVARALTGWTISTPQQGGGFVFRPEWHDAEAKTVLGVSLPAGRGTEDGEQVLDIVARHPSTAHFIAFKLARRFVSDTPSKALVDRAAAAFTATDGDIRETVRAIVTSPEFFARANYRSKVKTPFEVVVSARRALGAPVDTTPRTAQLMARLGQPLWGKLTPNGWPETGDEWMNSGAIMQRITFGGDVSAGKLGVKLEEWPAWNRLATAPYEAQVEGVVDELLAGEPPRETRAALMAGARPTLRDLVGMALGSPGFQRR